MKAYIFESKNKIYIIDLQQTLAAVNKAYKFVRDITARGHSLLLVGTKKQAKQAILDSAGESQMYYVNERWLGGTLTNNATLKQSITHLKELEKLEAEGGFESIPKKEASVMKKELARLKKHLSGIKDMEELPGVIFVVDPKKEKIAVREANKLNIPVIAIVDTNSDPDPIDVVIPGNDDAIKSVRLIASLLAKAAVEGHKQFVTSEGEARKAAELAEQEKAAAIAAARKQPAPKKTAPIKAAVAVEEDEEE